jgi:hypothetical protein
MKRVLIALVLLLAFSPITSIFAATTVSLWSHYDPVKDNYMVAYYKQIPDRPSSMKVKFVNPANTAANAQKVFSGTDITGIFYLTCNGQYNFDFYDTGGILVSSSQQITTTQVKNNLCDSYPSPEDQYQGAATPRNQNGVEVKPGDSPGGPRKYLYWKPSPNCGNGGYSYLFYRDGVFDHEFDPYSSNLYQYDITDKPGVWTIVTDYGSSYCNDLVGEVVYQDGGGDPTDPWAGVPAPGDGSSPNGPKGEPGSGPGNGGVVYPPFDPLCDTCVQLNQLLQCPDWEKYMDGFTDAFKKALPPPPDWQDIANKIGKATIDGLSDYVGEVPAVPSVPQIEGNIKPDIPTLNTDVPNIAPAVPPAYNDGPLPFDIKSGPQIPIVDESSPIEIYEPNKYIVSDQPGEMVLPGDSRNHSNGIKQPSTSPSPYPTPVPSSGSSPTIPPSNIPIPGNVPPSTMPVPGNAPPSTIPIPSGSGGPIPIPAGGKGAPIP